MGGMPNYSEVEQKLQKILQSRCRPVAITFAAEAPEGVAKFEGSQPSSCSYWRLAAERPELFAALGLISGGGDPGEANKIRNIPQYVVHGELDHVVPVARSRAMVEALRKAGATVVYVELPGAGHYETVAAQLRPMLDFFAGHARPAPR